MKQCTGTVVSNRPLTENVFEMRLACDTDAVRVPGQFVNVAVPGTYLRRPVSVCDRSGEGITLVYRSVGRGTERMAAALPGERFDLLTGLGNGYSTEKAGVSPLLIGGGAGVPPLYWLAKVLAGRGARVTVLLGFNTASEAFYEREFAALGARVITATADGSRGVRGFVTDALPAEGCSHFYACGPVPMLKAVCSAMPGPGEVSMEARMGCGFGACMGCSLPTKSGSRRICREGPVFDREELLWED